jgi:phage terminase small subunit
MACLFPPQHERFAVELSLFKTPVEAYKLAGYVPDRGNARKLARKPFIQNRVAELVGLQAELAEIQGARVLVELWRVGRANVADLFEDDGVTLKNVKKLPRELTAALHSLEWDEDGKPKVKLHDKNQANITLLKHLGGLPEPERPSVNILNILSVEDQRALAEALEALPGGPSQPGGGT